MVHHTENLNSTLDILREHCKLSTIDMLNQYNRTNLHKNLSDVSPITGKGGGSLSSGWKLNLLLTVQR